ncbi:MAG: hypothetical protein ACYDG6_06620 [Thermincolia bacterium]
MSKYAVTRACGHEETIALFGKVKLREWRLEHVEPNKLCSKCWQVEVEHKREEETKKAAEEAKESGLPELVGTEKQVDWAERIRIKLLSDFEEIVAKVSGQPKEKLSRFDLTLEKVDDAMKVIQNKTSASWWIDHRDVGTYGIAEILMKELKSIVATESKPPESAMQEAAAEATVRPEKPKTETPTEIRMVGDTLEIKFPEKRDDFREVMKEKLDMKWSGVSWQRQIIAKNGTLADRAAEAGHRLLAAGFVIRIFDTEIRQKAVRGEYASESTRWIQKRNNGEYAGWLAISWGREEDFYNAAKRISGARWSKPSVVVPPANFEEVLDFAKMYDFKVSELAQEAIEQARRMRDATLTVRVDAPVESKVVACGRPLLDIPQEVGIAEEFKEGLIRFNIP